MRPNNNEPRADFDRKEARQKAGVLKKLREEKLLLRANSSPHLRKLLDQRIDVVARDLANLTRSAQQDSSSSAKGKEER